MCSCCFPGSAKIWLETGSHLIPNLKTSDKLISISMDKKGHMNPVVKEDAFYSYIHFDAKKVAEFLSIRCGSKSETELLVSGSHLIFRSRDDGTCMAVPASSLRVGDVLIRVNQDHEITRVEVTEIASVTRTGVYAPLTKSGTLIVDGFLVSCYADVRSHSKAHKALAPLRFWYRYRKDQKKNAPGRKKDGIHSYATFLQKLNALMPMVKF